MSVRTGRRAEEMSMGSRVFGRVAFDVHTKLAAPVGDAQGGGWPSSAAGSEASRQVCGKTGLAKDNPDVT